VDKDGVLYVADGVTVRTVNQLGRINTIVGSQSAAGSWTPLLCYQTATLARVSH